MGKPKFASLIHNVSSPTLPEEKADMGIPSLLVRESQTGKTEGKEMCIRDRCYRGL